MDFVSTNLVVLKAPTGMWQSILNAFRGALGTYILAVILIAIIVRVLFALVDIVNKKVSMKNAEISNKMKPELDAIKAKYGNDPAMMQQKTSEIYKKYQFNMMSSCLPMLVALVLQFTVFLTLWNALQSVSNFNIVEKYENVKNVYTNVLTLNEKEIVLDSITENFSDGDQISVEIVEGEQKTFNVYVVNYETEKNIKVAENLPFVEDFANADAQLTSNEVVYGLIEKYVSHPENSEESEPSEIDFVREAIQSAAEREAAERYLETQEGFLWIKNIYKAESPTSPLFTESEIKTYLKEFYSDAEKIVEEQNDFEGKIFNNVVAGIDTQSLGVNGYYILTIIAVVTSVLSMWLSNFLMRSKNQPKQKQSWAMYVIMPIIIGIFTFMYTSLFAIYLIVGQLMMLLITPLTTLIVKKWNEKDIKKNKEKTEVVVDYRRKDI